MKKQFPLEVPNRTLPRVIELIKGDVRKYIKRERRKPLPEGVDFWDFDCRVGPDSDGATAFHVAEINSAIDEATQKGGPSVFVEILAKPGRRTRKNPVAAKNAEEKPGSTE